MSRCHICDHLEGWGSDLNILGRPSTRVRYRPHLSEYLCDDCAESIQSTVTEQKKDEWDGTIEQTLESLFSIDYSKYTTHEAKEPEPVD